MSRSLKTKDLPPWIDCLPEEWEISKIKFEYYLKARVGWKGLTSEEFEIDSYAYLITGTDFKTKSINLRSCYQVDKNRYEDDPYIQLRAGDLLITKDGTIGKISFVPCLDKPACLNSGIFVVRTRRNNSMPFLYWVLSSKVFLHFMDLQSTGSTIKHLYQEAFGNFSFPLPTLSEQRQIAVYLNRETAKLDKLITKQQKLIKLLQEKRQAVISQAVTNGLDPNVKMKDSGVEWLGEVPKHWTAGSLRWYVTIRSGDFIANTEFDTNQLRPCEVIGGNGVSGYTETFNVSKAIVVGRVGALCGNVHILSKPSWVTDNALILEFSNKLHDDYAAEYLRCLDLNKLANKNAQPLITGSMIKSQRCLIPPLSEQRLISKKVDQTYHQFGYLAERAEDSIRLLKEHRQALITAAVTGKIDVRGLVTEEELAALDRESDDSAFSHEEIPDLENESADELTA